MHHFVIEIEKKQLKHFCNNGERLSVLMTSQD